MSHITVHRRGKLRTGEIGRVAQIEALPPQPARHQGDHWDFTRRGFAHGFFPGHYDERTGKTDPIVAAAREAALEAGIDPALVEQIDIDDLIVTPEFISGSVGGINFRTSLLRTAQRLSVPDERYEMTEYGGTIPLMLTNVSLRPGQSHTSSVGVPGQIIATSVVMSADSDGGRNAFVTLGQHGLIAAVQDLSGGGDPKTPARTELSLVIPSPTTMSLEITNRDTAATLLHDAYAILSYRNARRVAQ